MSLDQLIEQQRLELQEEANEKKRKADEYQQSLLNEYNKRCEELRDMAIAAGVVGEFKLGVRTRHLVPYSVEFTVQDVKLFLHQDQASPERVFLRVQNTILKGTPMLEWRLDKFNVESLQKGIANLVAAEKVVNP